MNLSNSEINYASTSSLTNSFALEERVEASPTVQQQQSQIPTKLLRKSASAPGHKDNWDVNFPKDGSSSSHDVLMGRRDSLPAPPVESPGSAEESMKKVLAPEPGTPSVSRRSQRESGFSPSLSSHPLMSSPDGHAKKKSPNLTQRLSASSTTTQVSKERESTVPSLYKYARKCQWQEFSQALAANTSTWHDDIRHVYKKDGTTVLHMAVMSRTGYITAFKSCAKDFPMAPLELIEELLRLDPDVANVKCSLNGYTPLTYACLVCNDKYDVEDAAKMVRLFLKYCPGSIHLLTKEGLSPVDIHVVSYSHHHQEKEEESSRGRTSASVLRTLLTHSPELANNRLFGDKVKGPIELLYKCNSNVFTQAVMEELNEIVEEDGTVRSDFTIPERRQKVVETVKKWWIWTWAIMILKYGSLKQKKRGSQFAAVHSSCMQIACPSPLLSLIIYAFPRQIKQPILDKDDIGNLPLHAVCSWPCGSTNKIASQSLLATRKSQAISKLLEEYPTAVKVTNGRGESALELAVKTGTTWDGGVRRLVKAYPKALRMKSQQTSFYPFMTAAVAVRKNSPLSPEQDVQALRTIYGLLRSNPKVLSKALEGH